MGCILLYPLCNGRLQVLVEGGQLEVLADLGDLIDDLLVHATVFI